MSQPETAHASQRLPSGTGADVGTPYAVEYAIVAVLIAAVAVGTWKTFGEGTPTDAAVETGSAR
jgi:hypothetical protein